MRYAMKTEGHSRQKNNRYRQREGVNNLQPQGQTQPPYTFVNSFFNTLALFSLRFIYLLLTVLGLHCCGGCLCRGAVFLLWWNLSWHMGSRCIALVAAEP